MATRDKAFANAMREYFTKYPDTKDDKEAVTVVCQQLNLKLTQQEFEKRRGVAYVVKNRMRKAGLLPPLTRSTVLNKGKLDRRGIIKAVRGRKEPLVFDPHDRSLWGELPVWLAGAVGRAAEARALGWYVARSSMFQWYARVAGFEEPYSAQCYLRKRSVVVFPGRVFDLDRVRHVVAANLVSVLNGFGPGDVADPVRVQGYVADVYRFVGDLRLESGHIPIYVPGGQYIAPSTFRLDEFVTIKWNDGSHPPLKGGGVMEIILSHLASGGRDVRALRGGLADVTDKLQAQVGVEKLLPDLVKAAVDQSMSQSVAPAIAQGIGSALDQFSASFSEKFSAEFAKRMKELFGITEGGPADQQGQGNAASPADSRRYT
jgi:hypothetical protein